MELSLPSLRRGKWYQSTTKIIKNALRITGLSQFYQFLGKFFKKLFIIDYMHSLHLKVYYMTTNLDFVKGTLHLTHCTNLLTQ